MAAQVVADSGVFIAIIMKEPFGKRANRLVRTWSRSQVQVIALALFQYEIVAVIRKNVYRGLLSTDEGSKRLDLVFALTLYSCFVRRENFLHRGEKTWTDIFCWRSWSGHFCLSCSAMR